MYVAVLVPQADMCGIQVMERTSAAAVPIPAVVGTWAISLTSLDEVFVRVIAAAEREREAIEHSRVQVS